MINPALLRDSLPQTIAALAKRGVEIDCGELTRLENKKRFLQGETQQLQSQRNQIAKKIGYAKSQGEQDERVKLLIQEGEGVNEKLAISENELEEVLSSWQKIVEEIPNLPHESVPTGKDENDNVEIRKWGEIKNFSYTPKNHIDLGESQGGINTELAGKISGARFTLIQNQYARLHEAIARFMLDIHVSQHGYQEVYVPYLVNSSTLFGTGQLPKFSEDLFYAANDNLYLIPTAEVTLTNLVREQIIPAADLPMRWVSRTPCFRREAGSYGKDVRGMIRQHQFDKVELVWATTPEQSYEALEKMLGHAETVLQALELPYRIVQLCGGDMGFASAKTYDIEIWLPSQNTYREISSCSNCESFQARRMKARCRYPDGRKEYLHTLNGSGVAVGRAFLAVLENYQQEDCSVQIPKVLQPYCFGNSVIAAK